MRGRFPIILFALLMLIDIAQFLLQKLASDRAGVEIGHFWRSVTLQPWLWLSLALAPLQLLVWTRILSKADISLAFPLTSLSVPLTMLASAWLLNERPAWQVWAGGLLITIGAAILKPARSGPPERISGEVAAGR